MCVEYQEQWVKRNTDCTCQMRDICWIIVLCKGNCTIKQGCHQKVPWLNLKQEKRQPQTDKNPLSGQEHWRKMVETWAPFQNLVSCSLPTEAPRIWHKIPFQKRHIMRLEYHLKKHKNISIYHSYNTFLSVHLQSCIDFSLSLLQWENFLYLRYMQCKFKAS